MPHTTNIHTQEVLLHLKKGYGLGATLGHVRSLGRNAHRTNLAIFTSVVATMSAHGIELSQKKIRYHFYRFVPPHEYDGVHHLEVLKGIYPQ